jgi:hypothetical protein
MTQDQASACESRRPPYPALGGEWKNVDGRERRDRERSDVVVAFPDRDSVETRGFFGHPRRLLAPMGLERKPA